MSKKVIILGAGVYQVPLIKQAKEMGLFVIVCTIPGDYPGLKEADKIYYYDIKDKENILNMAISEGVQAILTTGSDVGVGTIGYVCDKLALKGINEGAAVIASDKAKMKEMLCANKVQTAEYIKIYSIKELEYCAKKLGYPLVVKCVDKSGSRGVVKVDYGQSLKKAYNNAMEVTDMEYIIAEQFISGYEIGLDGCITDDSIYLWPHDKIVYNNGSSMVPIGHAMPINCRDELFEEILSQAKLSVRALGINNTFFNMDIMINNGKAYIIEVGARLGATCIPEVVSNHYNFNIYEQLLNMALGNKITVPSKAVNSCIGRLIISEKDGKLKGIHMQDNAQELSQLVDYKLDYEIGQNVPKFNIGPNRIGHLVMTQLGACNTEALIKSSENFLEIVVE